MKRGVSISNLNDADFCQMKLAQNYRENIFVVKKDGVLVLSS